MGAAKIDAHALVSPDAEIGSDVTVGPFSIVEAGATVGAGTRIASHACIHTGTRLGRDNVVHMGVALGGEPQDRAYDGAPTRVVVGDRNIFREGCTVHRGTAENSETRIGDDCFLMANSHVGHNCVVGDGVVLANGALLGGHAQLGDLAFISGNSAVHQHIRIGRLALVQGSSAMSADLPPFCIGSGVNVLRVVNVVGLRRAGVDSHGIKAIRRAFRALFLGKPNLGRARARLREELASAGGATPEVEELLDFLDSGRRGFCAVEPLARPGSERDSAD